MVGLAPDSEIPKVFTLSERWSVAGTVMSVRILLVCAHQASPARTDLREFPGRTHWLIAQDGWQEVAEACLDWIGSLRDAPLIQRDPR